MGKESMQNRKPMILVLAGPNGSGKSTITTFFDKVGKYTNADDVVATTGMNNMEAAVLVDRMRYESIFVGASDGGMVAQIYTQKYPKEVGGIILISTGGMDAATLKSLKKKYFLAPLMLFYMKHCNYEKLKPKLIRAGMGHISNESKEEIAYAQEMFETIFKDHTKEKDVHISGLLADLMNQTPVTESDFKELEGKILLILPD